MSPFSPSQELHSALLLVNRDSRRLPLGGWYGSRISDPNAGLWHDVRGRSMRRARPKGAAGLLRGCSIVDLDWLVLGDVLGLADELGDRYGHGLGHEFG